MNVVEVFNNRGRQIGQIEYTTLPDLKDLFAYTSGKVFESSNGLKMSFNTLLECKSAVIRHSFLKRDLRVIIFY